MILLPRLPCPLPELQLLPTIALTTWTQRIHPMEVSDWVRCQGGQ